MNVTYIPCPADKVAKKCPHPMRANRVVVHNTANDASAYNEIRYMHRNDAEISFHYAVDDIGAVQGISCDRNAWHAGDGGAGVGNRQGIAVEICYSKSGGKRQRRRYDQRFRQRGEQLLCFRKVEYRPCTLR